eukprot:TRINITY_DN36877_c0_g1_i1.p1 TRINITY_DN36877_c0_g1~~TRINITY_DN36877_c0_g1_i1.p1  ORF type:complete len:257 (+),score=20.68 TRINITY_DN36877_c0_g1_i1:114-884(+)
MLVSLLTSLVGVVNSDYLSSLPLEPFHLLRLMARKDTQDKTRTLPVDVWEVIMSYCDRRSRRRLLRTNTGFSSIVLTLVHRELNGPQALVESLTPEDVVLLLWPYILEQPPTIKHVKPRKITWKCATSIVRSKSHKTKQQTLLCWGDLPPTNVHCGCVSVVRLHFSFHFLNSNLTAWWLEKTEDRRERRCMACWVRLYGLKDEPVHRWLEERSKRYKEAERTAQTWKADFRVGHIFQRGSSYKIGNYTVSRVANSF